VFSPYYAWSRRHGSADPNDHCAINIALYGPGRKRWAMTERRRGSLHQTPNSLGIGRSALSWDGDALTIDIDEITAPLPSCLRGRIRLHPNALVNYQTAIDPDGLHRWRPLAPCARVQVQLQSPSLGWLGSGYLDSNFGTAPLEDTLSYWHWSRAELRDGTAVLYDITPRAGKKTSLAMRFDRRGEISHFALPPQPTRLANSAWGIGRSTRADNQDSQITRTLEDTPFYARSVLSSRLLGERVVGIHESLNLNRFRSLWVQAMLPFRMPRARG
jgi:carotenoid 1,2-hydratase